MDGCMHAGCVRAAHRAAGGAVAGAAGGGDAQRPLLPLQPGPEHRRHSADRVLLQGGRRRRRRQQQQRLRRAEGVAGEGARPLLPAGWAAGDLRRGEAGGGLHGRRRRVRGGRGGLRHGGHRRRHRPRPLRARQARVQRPRRQEHTRDAAACSPGTYYYRSPLASCSSIITPGYIDERTDKNNGPSIDPRTYMYAR